MVVGISDSIDVQELRDISSYPKTEGFSYFTSPDFTEVSTTLDVLVQAGCGMTTPTTTPTTPSTTPTTPSTTPSTESTASVSVSSTTSDDEIKRRVLK